MEFHLESKKLRKSLGKGAPLKIKAPSSVREGAYAEIVMELQNGHTFEPISCKEFQSNSSHGMKIHYSLHWLASDSKRTGNN